MRSQELRRKNPLIIYKVVNKINGKIYIGQTIYSLEKRIAQHLCAKGYRPLSLAFRKYDIQAFEFSIIDSASSQEFLDAKEIYWIEKYNSKIPNGYNITNGGESANGYKHNAETIEKMSKAHKGKHHEEETKRKISKATKNRMRDPEERKKMSVSQIGENNSMFGKTGEKNPMFGRTGNKNPMFGKPSIWKGKHLPEETRRKMHKPHKKKIPYKI